ncbi:hypothetical protein ACFL0M_03690 [Thermodesulfobacteriota bacterium]
MEFEERRGQGYRPEEILLTYRDQESDRYDSHLPDDVLEFFEQWRRQQAQENKHRLELWNSDEWGQQVRLETVSREHLIHSRRQERVEILLSPHKYLYYVGIQQQLAVDRNDGLNDARRKLYLDHFWDSVRELRYGNSLRLPAQYAIHMAVVSCDNYVLLRQRRSGMAIYPDAWEASIGEFMHGPLKEQFTHFKDGKPSQSEFCRQAVAEEIGEDALPESDTFRLYGFATERLTLAPKMMVVHRSPLSIDDLEALASEKGEGLPNDPAQAVTRIKLSPTAIADAVTDRTELAEWGPTSKLALMLALTQGASDAERAAILKEVESEIHNRIPTVES